jgi:hypothetical protein
MATLKKYFVKFFCLLLLHLHHFSKIKSHKNSHKKSRNQGFSYYFGLITGTVYRRIRSRNLIIFNRQRTLMWNKTVKLHPDFKLCINPSFF